MRYFLILAFALVVSALVSNEAVAEPEVYMVEITPNTVDNQQDCLLYTSPSPRDRQKSRMPSSA